MINTWDIGKLFIEFGTVYYINNYHFFNSKRNVVPLPGSELLTKIFPR